MIRNEGEVSVTLLLNGGHTRTLYLRRKDPLLTSLLSSIGEKSYGGGRPARPFNIHLDQGRSSMIFSSTDLVGLITDPPVINEKAPRQPMLQAAAGPTERLPAEKSPYLMLENFVDPAAHTELLKFVMAREKDFKPSSVSTNDADYRRSQVLHDFPQFAGLFRDRVRSLQPQLAVAFGMGDFPIRDIECQLTAHNDGDYFKLHNDNGSPDTLERTISYVYYFNNEPKSFSGGEFRLYNSRIVNGRFECGEQACEIAPKNNSILFFPSHCHHEVLPVRCPSNRFVDSRFTVNGWVRRATAA
jgi:Rps23 Pro-64 3,4-dihydroxylase Tpa1-like proline 4-hydroxylase